MVLLDLVCQYVLCKNTPSLRETSIIAVNGAQRSKALRNLEKKSASVGRSLPVRCVERDKQWLR